MTIVHGFHRGGKARAIRETQTHYQKILIDDAVGEILDAILIGIVIERDYDRGEPPVRGIGGA